MRASTAMPPVAGAAACGVVVLVIVVWPGLLRKILVNIGDFHAKVG
jgi:hypothetical protein